MTHENTYRDDKGFLRKYLPFVCFFYRIRGIILKIVDASIYHKLHKQLINYRLYMCLCNSVLIEKNYLHKEEEEENKTVQLPGSTICILKQKTKSDKKTEWR